MGRGVFSKLRLPKSSWIGSSGEAFGDVLFCAEALTKSGVPSAEAQIGSGSTPTPAGTIGGTNHIWISGSGSRDLDVCLCQTLRRYTDSVGLCRPV